MQVTRQPGTESLLRDQFDVLRNVGENVRLDAERQRRVLLLSPDDWSQWESFLHDGPLPPRPPAPVMLRRLGAANYRLAALADRREGVAP